MEFTTTTLPPMRTSPKLPAYQKRPTHQNPAPATVTQATMHKLGTTSHGSPVLFRDNALTSSPRLKALAYSSSQWSPTKRNTYSTTPSTPTKRHTAPLSSSPPTTLAAISDYESEEDVDIFVDPRSRPSPPTSQAPKNVLEEISMPPPAYPQTPKRSLNAYQSFSPAMNSCHVDPSVLFNSSTNGHGHHTGHSSSHILSSSPPKPMPSHMWNSPSTPKTFSTIIHSSPLYPGFRSSPIHGSPSSLPHLVPYAPSSRTPFGRSNRSFRTLPKLDFEALAKAGRRHRVTKRSRKTFGSNSSARHSRATKVSPNKSLYFRRRDFLNSRREKNMTASSPIFPGSPKFEDALHFHSSRLMFGKGGLCVDLGLTTKQQQPTFKPRKISLSVDNEGRAIVSQEAEAAAVKPAPIPPVETLDSRYESSEEEDDEEEEEEEAEDEFGSEYIDSDVQNSPTPKKAGMFPSISSSFHGSPRQLAPPFFHKKQSQQQQQPPNGSPTSVSSSSPKTDFASMQSPISSPLHSPLLFKSPRFSSGLPKRQQNLEDVFPDINTPVATAKKSKVPATVEAASPGAPPRVEPTSSKPHFPPLEKLSNREEKPMGPKILNAREAFAHAINNSSRGSGGAGNDMGDKMHYTPARSFSAAFGSGLGLSPGPCSLPKPDFPLAPLSSSHVTSTPTFEDFMFDGYDDWAKSPSRFRF